MLTARLLVIVAVASSYKLEVPFWTDDAGYCEPLPNVAEGVHRPTGLAPLTVFEGTELVFKYSDHHDLWKHTSAASLAACTYTDAVMLAGRDAGGNCSNEANFSCMRAARGFTYRLFEVGTHYFSCRVHDHCQNGQRLTVTVLPSTAPVPVHPMHVPVPFWTDDAGYCKPIPGLDPGVHRPSGLRPITLLSGQSLLFKYSTHHDVWAHPSLESLEACDYSSAVMLAGRADGGGCTSDEDLNCIANGEGYALTPTQDEMYLSCSVHDHCENGQRVVVTVLPAPCPHETPTVDERRQASAILLVESVFGVSVTLLICAMIMCVLLCCVLRYTFSNHAMLTRRGGAGGAPNFNRLDTEMVGSAPPPGKPQHEAV